jgi:hypothetical protein
MALVIENGVWKLQAAASTSTAIWSADFTTEANHNFLSTATATIQGVDFTIANAARAGTFRIHNGTGLEIAIETAGSYWNNGLAPEIAADFSDLAALGAGGSFDVEKTYVWRIIMTSGSPQPAANYEGPFCGLRSSATLSTAGAHRHLCLFFDGSKKIRAGRSSGLLIDLASSSWPSGAQNPRTITNVYFRGSYQTLASDNAETDPLGGKVGYIGYQRNASSAGQVLDTSTPTLDLTAGASKAYIGCMGRASGASQTFIVEKAELHEIG